MLWSEKKIVVLRTITPAERAWQHARALFQQNRADLAEPILRNLLAAEPRHPFAPTLLAMVLIRLRRCVEALPQAQAAVQQQPDQGDAHYALAWAYAEHEQFNLARQHALEAIRLVPHEARYRNLLPSIEIELEQFAAAIAAAKEGLQLNSADKGLQRSLTVALAGDGRRDEALCGVEAILRCSTEDPLAFTCAARILFLLKDFGAAESHLRRALTLDANLGRAHAALGMVYSEQKRFNEAVPFLQEACRLEPLSRKIRASLEEAQAGLATASG